MFLLLWDNQVVFIAQSEICVPKRIYLVSYLQENLLCAGKVPQIVVFHSSATKTFFSQSVLIHEHALCDIGRCSW